MMKSVILWITVCFGMLALSGASCDEVQTSESKAEAKTQRSANDGKPAEQADFNILFVGNSHTTNQNLPKLVCRMVQFLEPDRKATSRVIAVPFLEDVPRTTDFQSVLASRKWTTVILQAQKISVSGRFQYSRAEGIDLARRAKASGAGVSFYSEWGLKGVAGDADRNEAIYVEMARDSETEVAPVGRAWDIALGEKPTLELHEADGNHQTHLGAFLTACVIAGRVTGKSPEGLAEFPDKSISKSDRALLAASAAKTIEAFAKVEQQAAARKE